MSHVSKDVVSLRVHLFRRGTAHHNLTCPHRQIMISNERQKLGTKVFKYNGLNLKEKFIRDQTHKNRYLLETKTYLSLILIIYKFYIFIY